VTRKHVYLGFDTPAMTVQATEDETHNVRQADGTADPPAEEWKLPAAWLHPGSEGEATWTVPMRPAGAVQ
jgi:hypothetical protein